MKAREIMSSNVEVASLDDSIAQVAKRMADGDFGAMPVCTPERRLQGMITDRDITVSVVAKGKDPDQVKVKDIVDLREVVTIGADDSLEEAVKTMKDHAVRRLPVIDGHDLVGMVATADLALHVRDEKAGDLLEAISAAP